MKSHQQYFFAACVLVECVFVTLNEKIPPKSFFFWLFLCHYLQKDSAQAIGMHRSKSKHELKLLEKIPENAEATIVLVGKQFYSDSVYYRNPAGFVSIWTSPKGLK